jgi:hypothetical protein
MIDGHDAMMKIITGTHAKNQRNATPLPSWCHPQL